jgi:hypothetical protein
VEKWIEVGYDIEAVLRCIPNLALTGSGLTFSFSEGSPSWLIVGLTTMRTFRDASDVDTIRRVGVALAIDEPLVRRLTVDCERVARPFAGVGVAIETRGFARMDGIDDSAKRNGRVVVVDVDEAVGVGDVAPFRRRSVASFRSGGRREAVEGIVESRRSGPFAAGVLPPVPRTPSLRLI